MKQWQRYLAELFGTFVLVFAGCTSVLAANKFGGGGLTEIVVPLGFGLALMAGLYTFAEVSGGHFNPVVSLGLFLDRRLTFEDLLGYWIFQFAGAILASLLMLIPFTHDLVKSTATVPSAGTGNGAAFFLEAALTAIFVLVILVSTKSERFGGTALVAIPLTLAAAHFAIVTYSGCSLNPARSLGPALVGGQWHAFWIYIVATPVGAVIAWIVYTIVIKGETTLPVRPPSSGGETPASSGGETPAA